MSRSSDLQIFEGSSHSRKGEHNLPSFNSPFVGRDANVTKITNMLLTDRFTRAVHITGAPAIGKTRLAVQVGFNLVEHGVDVRYIRVTEQWLWVQPNKPTPGPSDSSKSDKDTTALIKSGTFDLIMLGYLWFFPKERMKDVLPSASDLIEWMEDLKFSTVVILDNCDDVLEGHLQDDLFDLIQKLHNASNLVKTISTSRVHFTPTGVKHFPLGALDVISSTDLLQCECENINNEEARQIAGLVGCNPLGLLLAAGLACDMPVQALIGDLEDDSIKTLSCESIPSQQKMDSLIETSINRLEQDMKLCAKNISLFPSSLSQEAGKRVLSGLGVQDITNCLNKLVRRSLLEWYYIDSDSRYIYHQLIKDFLKPMSYNYYYEGDSGFCVHYVSYYTWRVMNLIEDCRIEFTKYCKHWFRSEDQNVRHVLDAISYCPLHKKVETLVQWRGILTSPIFWEFYDEETVAGLIHKGLQLILKLYDTNGVDTLKSYGRDLNATFSILSKQAIEWNRATFTYLRQKGNSFSYFQRPAIVRELINLCAVECQMYCTESDIPTIYFHLCRLSCDRDCRYYITEMCLVALFTSVLLPHVAQILKLPKTRYRWVNSIVLHVSVYAVSLMASNTPAHYLAKLVQLCTPYVLPLIQNGVSISTDSRYLFITMLELMMMIMSASATLRFGGLKSFLSFPVSMLILYCLSDYISFPFTVRVITVLCVWLVSTRSVTLLKLSILLLVLAGQGLVLTECSYLSGSSVLNTKSCQYHAIISIYTV